MNGKIKTKKREKTAVFSRFSMHKGILRGIDEIPAKSLAFLQDER